MALNKEQLLDAIDKMTLYQQDYDTISSLLSITTNELFTKIVEEVVNGNLYWSDFEPMLSGTGYAEILEGNIVSQEKLWESINRIIKLKSELNENYLFSDDMTSLALTSEYYSDILDKLPEDERAKVEKRHELYTAEYKKYRNNVLYELSKIKRDDSELVKAYKIRLYNAIRNGELILNSEGDDYEIYPTYVKNKGSSEKFEYINPEDIFLFLNEYAIPIDYNYQTLDSFDIAYMHQHNMTEEQVKQIKSIALFIKNRDIIGGVK